MIKIVVIYDQIQAGLGTKTDTMIPLGAKNVPIGPSIMMERFFKEYDEKIMACFFCGTGTYYENKQEISRKICNKVEMIKPDVVLCGPAFDYKDYAKMCAELSYEINDRTSVPAFASMAKENEEVIAAFKEKVNIVRCPKKGEAELNKSLKNICSMAKILAEKSETKEQYRDYIF